ncbi:MAG: serine/threonine protein kinase [Labilithrix sp.]|nr:serine/threonine protein kinase [Labilithrix sp.]
MTAAERRPLRVVGRYALYSEIAAGGMATVHIGRLLGPVGFARTVAVKRLHPQYAKDPEFVSMFLDEARLAARVQHPNVVATIDVVATEGELFLIMDYVRGESLSKLLRTARKQGVHVPPRIAASILCGFLHGLHAAHEAKNERGEPINLVHRDVSPQNVLVGADGIARVLDFGIAKAQGRIQVTRDGQIKGKLAYMPPEQLSGRETTRAVDIYASAVVMWEMLTNERLFKGETEAETLAKILRDPVVAPSAAAPSIPKAFDAPILKALSREAKKRHATARELAFDLEKCVGVASATEVGEWVEEMVGAILSAREDQIAQMESNSASLPISEAGIPQTPESSDSDVSLVPSGPAGTLIGVGPSSGRLDVGAPPSSRRTNGASANASGGRAPEESTGSKVTGSRFTGTMSLPVDRKLPILASLGGLVVLLVILGVVITGRESPTQGAAPDPSSSASTALAIPPAPTPTPSAVLDPAPLASVTAAPSDSVAVEEKPPDPKPETKPPPVAPPPVRPPVPVVTKPPAPPTPARKDCVPPYTIDANGRKKYKLECM